MRRVVHSTVLLLALLLVASTAWAIKNYHAPIKDLEAVKGTIDDPAPFYTDSQYYKIFIPDEVWKTITHDPVESRAAWEKAVGFRAKDVVGQIAPEIKPGKYTLSDKEKYPFKELMTPYHYNRFNAPGTEGLPKHIGYFTEFEVIETQQLWHGLPVGKASLENMGKTQLDEQGYIKHETFVAGYPFPRPSGDNMGWQIINNWQKRPSEPENAANYDLTIGVNSRGGIDHRGTAHFFWVTLEGRVMYPPYGWFDKRSQKQGESLVIIYTIFSPRDLYGNVYHQVRFSDPKKDSNFLAYVNFLRRIRKLSSTDRQDQAVGQDICFDDASMFAQTLRPDRYPYETTVIEEREFLVPAYSFDGSDYLDSKDGWKWKGLKFERRPMWVLEMKQLDKNYIYSKRVFYFDKETLLPQLHLMYDQKGRLYRMNDLQWGMVEPLGYFNTLHVNNCDFIDEHCTWTFAPSYPALWLERKDLSLRSMMKQK